MEVCRKLVGNENN